MKSPSIFYFGIILLSLNSSAQNTIRLYNVPLKASEVLGTGKSWGPAAGDNKTILLTHATNELRELLGQIYKTDNIYATYYLGSDYRR